MSRTMVGVNDPKAVHRYSAFLAVDTARIGYFSRKFMGVGAESMTPIQLLPQLENDAGENISYDLSVQLKQEPVFGDDVQEGTEEGLKFYTDNLYIDQVRGGVNSGGRMTRKRTVHNLRKIGRKRQSEWWARVFDELIFMYASGARGVNEDYVFRPSFTGFAGNVFTAPDADHLMYAGSAVSKATLTASDKADLKLVDRLKTRATVMGGGIQETPQIQPIKVDGEEKHVLLMHPWQEYDVRTNTTAGQWLDIQKAAAAAEGRSNPIYKGALGEYNGVVLHAHKGVIRFSDYGVGSDVAAARALFLGSQAVVMAFGSPGTGLRFSWHEETRDNGNQLIISTSSILGLKKSVFNGKDFGVISADTAAVDPQ